MFIAALAVLNLALVVLIFLLEGKHSKERQDLMNRIQVPDYAVRQSVSTDQPQRALRDEDYWSHGSQSELEVLD